jgi:hypothetical protein
MHENRSPDPYVRIDEIAAEQPHAIGTAIHDAELAGGIRLDSFASFDPAASTRQDLTSPRTSPLVVHASAPVKPVRTTVPNAVLATGPETNRMCCQPKPPDQATEDDRGEQ